MRAPHHAAEWMTIARQSPYKVEHQDSRIMTKEIAP